MQALHKGWLLLLCALLLFFGCSDQQAPKGPSLTIAGAANLRFALEELTNDFTATTGIPTEVVLASSGKLTAQIKAGAPYDIFLSADEQYPAALTAAGLTKGQPQVYALGPLALWTTTNDIPLDADSLMSARIVKIAIPNPTTAPYGKAAMAFLANRGLDSLVADKLVFGESVGQANQFVYSGAAELGFTAAATVTINEKKLKSIVLEDHPPVIQSSVVLSSSTQLAAATAFSKYLRSDPAQQTLQKFGYFAAE